MSLRITARLVLFFIVAAPPAVPGTRPSPVSNLTVVYDFYFGGLWAAEMEISDVASWHKA